MNCFEDVKKNCFSFLKMTAAPMNSAFVFIKPHANKEPVQKLVKETLESKGIKILKEGDYTGPEIDKVRFSYS